MGRIRRQLERSKSGVGQSTEDRRPVRRRRCLENLGVWPSSQLAARGLSRVPMFTGVRHSATRTRV